MPSYEAEIPESQKKDSDIISVKAKSFADREIRYTLKAQGQGAGTFNIGPSSGIVKLAKDLDFEDLRQPHIYQLVVTATEDSGGFSTHVELMIRVSDVNDNAPKFELPDYQVRISSINRLSEHSEYNSILFRFLPTNTINVFKVNLNHNRIIKILLNIAYPYYFLGPQRGRGHPDRLFHPQSKGHRRGLGLQRRDRVLRLGRPLRRQLQGRHLQQQEVGRRQQQRVLRVHRHG